MRRRLLAVASVLSLFLSVAVAVLWALTFFWEGGFKFHDVSIQGDDTYERTRVIVSHSGGISWGYDDFLGRKERFIPPVQNEGWQLWSYRLTNSDKPQQKLLPSAEITKHDSPPRSNGFL